MHHLADCPPALSDIFDAKECSEHSVLTTLICRKLKNGNDGICNGHTMLFTATHEIFRSTPEKPAIVDGILTELIRRNIFFGRITRC